MNYSTHILASLTLLGSLAVAEAAQFAACKFKDDKKAAISITLDGAMRKQYDIALPLLDKYNFKATFYIPVNSIPNSPDDGVKAKNAPGWEDLKDISAKGHELGNASMNYSPVNNQPETKLSGIINDPIAIIKEKTGVDVETFGPPAGGCNDKVRKIIMEKHLGVSPWRIGFGNDKNAVKTAADICESRLARRDDVAILLAQNVTAAEIETLLKTLKSVESQIWIDTYANVCKYVILRDQGKLNVKAENGNVITVELISPRKETDKTELTVRYDAPETITVSQNGKPIKTASSEEGTIFNVVPGEFTVTVNK